MDERDIIGTPRHPVKLRAIHSGTVTLPKGILRYILSGRMLKKSASLSCSFGLFGLSGVFGCMRLTRWTRQTGLVPHARTIEVLACQHNFPAVC